MKANIVITLVMVLLLFALMYSISKADTIHLHKDNAKPTTYLRDNAKFKAYQERIRLSRERTKYIKKRIRFYRQNPYHHCTISRTRRFLKYEIERIKARYEQ